MGTGLSDSVWLSHALVSSLMFLKPARLSLLSLPSLKAELSVLLANIKTNYHNKTKTKTVNVPKERRDWRRAVGHRVPVSHRLRGAVVVALHCLAWSSTGCSNPGLEEALRFDHWMTTSLRVIMQDRRFHCLWTGALPKECSGSHRTQSHFIPSAATQKCSQRI